MSAYQELLNHTLSELKEMARSLGVPVTGTKSDLADRIFAVQNGRRDLIPTQRRQNPYQTPRDLPGIVADVASRQVSMRSPGIAEAVAAELATWSIEDFKNAYETIGLTRPQPANKANYTQRLTEYLNSISSTVSSFNLPTVIPAAAGGRSVSPSRGSQYGLPTVAMLPRPILPSDIPASPPRLLPIGSLSPGSMYSPAHLTVQDTSLGFPRSSSTQGRPVSPPRVPAARSASPVRIPSGRSMMSRQDQIAEISRVLQTTPVSELVTQAEPTRIYQPNNINIATIANMIREHQFVSAQAPVTFYRAIYPQEYILASLDGDNTAAEVLTQLGYPNFGGSYDDKLAFLRLVQNYPYRDLLNPPQVALVTSMTNQELLALLGEDYFYPRDRASMLWTLIKRRESPFFSEDETVDLPELLTYPMVSLARIAVDLYDYYGNDEIENSRSDLSYARFIALRQPRSVLEPFILNFDGDPDTFAANLGMVFPSNVTTEAEKTAYYFKNLRYYEGVFTRPENLTPPPLENLPNAQQLRSVLSRYTDQELIDAYELNFQPTESRSDFLEAVVAALTLASEGPIWSFRKSRCANDDRFNIITTETRDKNDPADPILSYGTLTHYDCYNKDELEATFRQGDGGFEFGIPGWKRGDPRRTSLFQQ